MIRKAIVGIVAVLTMYSISLGGWLAAAQTPASTAGVVATVGPLRITRGTLEQRAQDGVAEYQRRLGTAPSPDLRLVIERQALESLIRSRLLTLEAQRRGVAVGIGEVDQRLRNEPFFMDGGKVVEERFQKAKQANSPQFQKAAAEIRQDLAARKLHQQIVSQASPEEALIRTIAKRALTRVSLDHLSLRFTDFTGEEGEPREAEVIAYHRAHAAEFQRQARAMLTILQIHPLLGTESDAILRARADSVLAEIRNGARLEQVSEGRGTLRRNVVVLAGNFPGYWKGSARIDSEIFRQPAGRMWPEPIPAQSGWVVARVESAHPAGPATLAESSREIRDLLRAANRKRRDEHGLRAAYDQQRASLATNAYRLRYAIVDTTAFDPGQPTAADLDLYYRSHQADYTRYDAATSSLQITPLAEVREEIQARWRIARRAQSVRAYAQTLAQAWGANRRDRGHERKATIRERGPVPQGATIDGDFAGQCLSDSLARRGITLGVQVIPYPGGSLVVNVYDRIPDYVPAFEQALPYLRSQRDAAKQREEELAARLDYERDPGRFAGEKVVYLTRLIVEPPNPMLVPLTRREIERWFQENMNRYSAPEMVTARHILISPDQPGAEGDAAALREAEDLARRIRSGEDFAELARRHSDDPATRDKGGDLGPFGRGVMLSGFEAAAFAMKPGQVSDPVKTEVGYHIIKVTDYAPLVAEPLDRMYMNVGIDAATAKADRIARARADSLLLALKSVKQAKAAAARLGLEMNQYTHPFGKTDYPDEVRESILRLETFPVGKIVPMVYQQKGIGHVIEWSDSIATAPIQSWERVRGRMLEEYRRGAARRAFSVKRAELDSLERAGWSLDSLAALWGGFQTAYDVKFQEGLPDLGGPAIVDSLAFGGVREPALEPGEATGWIELPLGFARLRLRERREPAAAELAARMERERRLIVERHLYDFFFELKSRHPVRILDETLRGAPSPPAPEPGRL